MQKEDKSLKQISDVIKSLPKFQKLYSKFSLHISLAKKCMDEFTSRNLEKLCAAEQDVATGVTDSGKKLDNSQLADVVLQVCLTLDIIIAHTLGLLCFLP